ncbi:TraR/DksA family transcriptional regulator [Syntrophus buswellii]|uniref:TraR/DksA family transcriptional regulator n=1 Tax=Syntrophus buswellii TaxID=43774 RepID=UPI0038D49289
MEKEILNDLRNLLVLQRRRLHCAACRTVSDMKKNEGKLSDPLDRAVVEFDRQMELSMRGRETSALRDIQRALDRIDQGIFGVCDLCGRPISEKRLLARPTTMLCVHCQHQQETISGKRTYRSFEDEQRAIC